MNKRVAVIWVVGAAVLWGGVAAAQDPEPEAPPSTTEVVVEAPDNVPLSTEGVLEGEAEPSAPGPETTSISTTFMEDAGNDGEETADDPTVAREATDADLFHWLFGTTRAPLVGLLYALLGLTGALITVGTMIGGTLPWTAGATEIDKDAARLAEYYAWLDALKAREDTDSIPDVNQAIDSMRDDLRKERWLQFGLGAAFYTLIGAVLAMALAQDFLQALVIGAGWTALAGNLGLKADYKARSDVKDETLGEIKKLVEGLRQQQSPALAGAKETSARSTTVVQEHRIDLAALERKIDLARSL